MAAPAGPTRLAYFDDMWALRAAATVLSLHQEEGGRRAVLLDATVFHPQGGGQPADTGVIVSASGGGARFLVEDVRVKDGVVFHYGRFEDAAGNGCGAGFTQGHSVTLEVDAERRKLNSRIVAHTLWLGLALAAVILRVFGSWTGFMFLPLPPPSPVPLLQSPPLLVPSSSGIFLTEGCYGSRLIKFSTISLCSSCLALHIFHLC